MDDSLLTQLREQPSPEFAERLRVKLQERTPAAPPSRAWVMRRTLAWLGAAAAVAILFTVPAVRASAQAFLNLFRVVNFVAVPVEERRASMLESDELDLPGLIGEQITVLTDPGAPVTVTSIEAAAAMAGLRVQVPASLPDLTTLTRISVRGERAVHITASTDRLQAVLKTLAISDIDIPPDLNGRSATLQVPPVVELLYEQQGDDGRGRQASLLQVRSPTVSMPEGLNLETLGEIGLRVLGLEAGEASCLAQQVDWHSTLVVPIPPNVSRFHQVRVRGAEGLGLESPVRTAPDGRRERVSIVIWSTEGRVLALEGTFSLEDLLQIAHSIE